MKGLIDHINQKDYVTRRRWLISLCAIAGVLVVIIWMMILQNVKPSTAENNTTPAKSDAASSLDTLGKKIQDSWNTMKESIGGTVVELQKAASSTEATSTATSTN